MSEEPTSQFPRLALLDHVAVAASPRDGRPVRPPADVGAFRFAVVAALRAGQLLRGCVPRIDGGAAKATVIAQLEVASGRIAEVRAADAPGTRDDASAREE